MIMAPADRLPFVRVVGVTPYDGFAYAAKSWCAVTVMVTPANS